MITEAIGRLLPVLCPVLAQPAAVGLLLAVAVIAIAALVADVTRPSQERSGERSFDASFALLRPRLRSSDPDAAGHRRARAPGAAV